jgi:hypothetical protein
MSVRSVFSSRYSNFAVVVVLTCLASISANAQSVPDEGTLVNDSVASRAHQLETLNQNIQRWGCDKPQYATSVIGCRQLNAQAASLAASIDDLKKSGDQAANEPVPEPAKAVAAQKPPLKMLTFRSKTNPSGYYRTFCVKLCDGSPIPMSYSTRPGNFLSDGDRCQSSCPSSPSKLFYAPTDQGVEQSVGLDGQRYSNLPNALRHRTELVEDCRCKPEPWSKEAKTEYQRREVVATQSSGERIVAAGISESAKAAAGGAVEIADEVKTRPSISRPKDSARYRFSSADDAAGSSSRNGYYARDVNDPRSAYAQPQPQRRKGFFLFGSR